MKWEFFKPKEKDIPAWRKESVPTDRGMKEYCGDLGLNVEDLKNKKILDVGSGTSRFAKEVSGLNIGAEVFSMDPYFSLPEKERYSNVDEVLKANQISGVKEMTVGAIPDDIPFKPEVFDLIVMMYSIPEQLPLEGKNLKEKIEKIFNNLDLVLKEGGEIRISPLIFPTNRGMFDEQNMPIYDFPQDRYMNEAIDQLIEKGYSWESGPKGISLILKKFTKKELLNEKR